MLLRMEIFGGFTRGSTECGDLKVTRVTRVLLVM